MEDKIAEKSNDRKALEQTCW